MSKTAKNDALAHSSVSNGPHFGKKLPAPSPEAAARAGGNMEGLPELASRQQPEPVVLPPRAGSGDVVKFLEAGGVPLVTDQPRSSQEPVGTSDTWRKDGKRY